MHKLFVIDKENKGRRAGRRLRHIEYLKTSALIRRGLNTCSCIAEKIIKHTLCGVSGIVRCNTTTPNSVLCLYR